MISTDNIHVYFVLGSTDMRKGIDSLSMVVASHEGCNPLDGSMYVFCSKNKKNIKVLYWDRNGFVLYIKRNENGKFQWPESCDNILTMSYRELRWLLDGLSPVKNNGFKKKFYESII